jgi:hypothetical protein
MNIDNSYFWTDSQLVLQYIQNEKGRFHVFVANRVATIHQACEPEQWRFIQGDENPADVVTRGLSSKEILKEAWLYGPNFLKKPEKEWNIITTSYELSDNDPEVKRLGTFMADVEDTFIDKLIARYSSFYRLKRAVGWLLLLKGKLLANLRGTRTDPVRLTVEILQQAERQIVKHVQRSTMSDEYKSLKNGKSVKNCSPVLKLSPVLQEDIICVGG